MFKKNIIIVILATVLISICAFHMGKNSIKNEKMKSDKEYYISESCFRIDNLVRVLSSVKSGNKYANNAYDVMDNSYSRLLLDLYSLKDFNKNYSIYLIDNQYKHLFNSFSDALNIIFAGIGEGISYNNKLICKDFLNDRTISENEILFLTSLKKDLQRIENHLLDKATRMVNLNLSMKELSKILQPFINKYSDLNIQNLGLQN